MRKCGRPIERSGGGGVTNPDDIGFTKRRGWEKTHNSNDFGRNWPGRQYRLGVQEAGTWMDKRSIIST